MCNRFLKTYVHTTGNDSISKSREKLKTLVFNFVNISSCTGSSNQTHWARKKINERYISWKKNQAPLISGRGGVTLHV